jgi:hypothetical protein
MFNHLPRQILQCLLFAPVVSHFRRAADQLVGDVHIVDGDGCGQFGKCNHCVTSPNKIATINYRRPQPQERIPPVREPNSEGFGGHWIGGPAKTGCLSRGGVVPGQSPASDIGAANRR